MSPPQPANLTVFSTVPSKPPCQLLKRLQLGADAVAATRSHCEMLLKDLATWETLASGTSFGPNVA
jgi:hypothetical protein